LSIPFKGDINRKEKRFEMQKNKAATKKYYWRFVPRLTK
jgi:dipeptidase